MLHQGLHGKGAQKFHWTVSTVKDTVSQDAERQINSSPLPKMERFYSLFQTCATATYLCWLWLLQDPSVNQFNRIYTQPKKKLTVFFWVRKERWAQQSARWKGYIQTASWGSRKGVRMSESKAIHHFSSSKLLHWLNWQQDHHLKTSQHLTFAAQITIINNKTAKDSYNPIHLHM